MRDLLGGLRHPRARGYEKAYPQGYSPHQAYNEALDDATAALRNPTDEQVEAIAGRLDLVGLTWMKVTEEVQDEDSTPPYLMTSMRQRPVVQIVRAVLAAAGGDDD